jgi:hypothetical protein
MFSGAIVIPFYRIAQVVLGILHSWQHQALANLPYGLTSAFAIKLAIWSVCWLFYRASWHTSDKADYMDYAMLDDYVK